MSEITYNLKIQFSQSEHSFWLNLLKMERNAYNICSKIVFEKKLKMNLKIVYDNTYHLVRREIPNLPSQGVNKVIKEVIGNYRAIKKNGHHIDEPAEKKNLSMRLDKRLCSNYDKTGIDLISSTPHKRQRVSFDLYPEIEGYFDRYSLSDPLIFYRNGQFFISCTFKIPEKPLENPCTLGVDLGMRMLAVTSDGQAFKANEYLGYKRRIRHNKRIWKGKIYGIKNKKTKIKIKGTNSHSARTKLMKAKDRERNFSKNYIHQLTNQILKTDKGIIVLEDLSKIKENTKNKKLENGMEVKNKRHNNRISQIPFYMIKMILSYKAPLVGKQVVTVNPANTSRTDSQTGRKSGDRRGRRFYARSGKVYDADWNAAINIAKRHNSRKHPVSFKKPLDGTLNLMGRLLSTSQKSGGGHRPLSWQADSL